MEDATAPPVNQAAHILVVDDDVATGDMLVDLLGAEGYTVEHARHGVDALVRVQAQPPDVILLDLVMPVMDGPTFAAAYRGHPGPHAPIIAMTASTSLVDAIAALRPAAVLQKPFELAALLDVVREALAR